MSEAIVKIVKWTTLEGNKLELKNSPPELCVSLMIHSLNKEEKLKVIAAIEKTLNDVDGDKL